MIRDLPTSSWDQILLRVKIYLQDIEWRAGTGLIWLMIETNGSGIEGDFLTGFAARSRDSLQAAAVNTVRFWKAKCQGGVELLCGRNEQATCVQARLHTCTLAHMHTGLTQPAARSKETQK